jgi:hypothetical protein
MVSADVWFSCMFIGYFTIGMYFIVSSKTMWVPLKVLQNDYSGAG